MPEGPPRLAARIIGTAGDHRVLEQKLGVGLALAWNV